MRRSHFPAILTWAVLIFFYVPIILLVINSFNLNRQGTVWTGFTLKWYEQLFSAKGRAIWSALSNTLIVALLSTVGATILGTCGAFALHKFKSKFQNFHYCLIYTPLVVPDILIGISLLIFFMAVKIQLGLSTIVIAHITFCVSYVAMAVLSRLQDFDMTILEAARDLGANRWTTTWKVLVPIILPGIFAGALLAFTLSIDDFVITFFVNGPGTTTLPIQIQGMIKRGALPLINALSTLLLAITFLAILGYQILLKRSQRQSG
ncbi:MAG: ABC transporter permease [Lentisphaeria bacterium]|nr:ABC transporter permease [Lentisphaeria bacterium]